MPTKKQKENKGKPVGHPPIFKSKKQLRKLIDAYFDKCEKKKKPLTMGGLAVALDVDRRTIINYGNKDKFFPTIKKAREICEAYSEETLYTNRQVVGVIFALKNNYGWVNDIPAPPQVNLNLTLESVKIIRVTQPTVTQASVVPLKE